MLRHYSESDDDYDEVEFDIHYTQSPRTKE